MNKYTKYTMVRYKEQFGIPRVSLMAPQCWYSRMHGLKNFISCVNSTRSDCRSYGWAYSHQWYGQMSLTAELLTAHTFAATTLTRIQTITTAWNGHEEWSLVSRHCVLAEYCCANCIMLPGQICCYKMGELKPKPLAKPMIIKLPSMG